MKKFILIAISALGLTLSLNAQRNKVSEEVLSKVKSQKIAYLTEKLDLSEEEAMKFWPVFNQYEKEREVLRKNISAPQLGMTEQEANKSLESLMAYKEQELANEKKYVGKLKSILPTTKVIKLFHYEREFRKEIVENIKDRMDSRKRKN